MYFGVTKRDNYDLLLILLVFLILVFLIRPYLLIISFHVFSEKNEDSHIISSKKNLNVAPKIPSRVAVPPKTWQQKTSIPTNMQLLNDHIFDLMNGERIAVGAQELDRDSTLDIVAYRHSKDMFERKFYAHDSPDGDGPAMRVALQHRRLFGLTRENIHKIVGSTADYLQLAQQFNRDWMNSPGHRRNMLAKEVNVAGVGCYEATDLQYGFVRYCTQLIVQSFGYAQSDFPVSIQGTQELTISLGDTYGAEVAGISMRQLNTSITHANTKMVAQGERFQGVLWTTGPANSYQLYVHIPDKSDPNMFSLVQGPLLNKN